MCDTVCTLRPEGTLFAKNSDRPVDEVQLIERYGRRPAHATLRTQYLEIADAGAHAMMGSRPAWLWGLEHGVNEHRVAIGNERVFTVDDAHASTPALIGMDLVRLGLERASTADEALDVMTTLLEVHGQGGVADAANDDAYFSSFIVADPRSAWILETSGRTWAAQPVARGAAISNRISLTTEWTRASTDVAPGTSFDRWRDPRSWSAQADVRLACTRPAVTDADAAPDPAELAALLRDHGTHRWGRPGADLGDVAPLPVEHIGPNAEGFSVCMHLRGYQATAASMICELPDDERRPLRAWVASGSPCVSVYVPVFPPDDVPAALSDENTWKRFLALRDRVEADGAALAEVREVLAPIEAELWEEADEVADRADRRAGFVARSWAPVDRGLSELGV
jgi:dipeptidase